MINERDKFIERKANSMNEKQIQWTREFNERKINLINEIYVRWTKKSLNERFIERKNHWTRNSSSEKFIERIIIRRDIDLLNDVYVHQTRFKLIDVKSNEWNTLHIKNCFIFEQRM